MVEELKKLRENLARQQDQKYEMDWEQLSRAAHWTNTAINMSTINNARRKAILGASEVKLKTTFNPEGYFGPNSITQTNVSLPSPLLIAKHQRQEE